MNKRNSINEKIQVTLLPLARQHASVDIEISAIVDQWIHAIATDSELYCNLEVCAREELKSMVLALLKKSDIATDNDSMFEYAFGEVNIKPARHSKFKFIDLFAGIGGVRLGFQYSGGTCVFSSEYDKSAQKTYKINHGELPFGDITEINEKFIPQHDVLLAGFPCQPFSHAGVSARMAVGKQHGFLCDTQGTLFFDVLRVVQEKRPKIVFLENVKNLEKHDNGKTFEIIKEGIKASGYHFSYAVIDSSSVVPQRRVRCYMVGVRKDIGDAFVFPDFSGQPLPLRSILEKEVDDIYTISDRLWAGHIARTKRNVDRGTGFTAYVANLDKPSNTIVARYGKDGKECLIPQEGKNPRMLTQRECARLQGFPESFKVPSVRTPAYKQFGNSVVVPVIEKISRKIVNDYF